MKTKQILMAGALALSMVLSGGMLTDVQILQQKTQRQQKLPRKKK